jgi:hypothetical protein
MTKLEKVLGLFLTCVLVAVFCLIVMLRRSRESVEAAGRESAELRVQSEDLETKLAALRGEFGRQQAVQPVVGLIAGQPLTNDFAELSGRMDQLAAQQSNILASLQNLSTTISLIETPTQKHQNYQHAVTALSAKAAKQEGKMDSARLKLEQLMTSLNVSDDVAALDDDMGLSIPSLRAYWPYFETRKEWLWAQRNAKIIRMKLQMSEIDTEVDTESQTGVEFRKSPENSK